MTTQPEKIPERHELSQQEEHELAVKIRDTIKEGKEKGRIIELAEQLGIDVENER